MGEPERRDMTLKGGGLAGAAAASMGRRREVSISFILGVRNVGGDESGKKYYYVEVKAGDCPGFIAMGRIQ